MNKLINDKQGLSLADVVVGMTIIAIISIGLFSYMDSIIRVNHRNKIHKEVREEVVNYVEELNLIEAATPDELIEHYKRTGFQENEQGMIKEGDIDIVIHFENENKTSIKVEGRKGTVSDEIYVWKNY